MSAEDLREEVIRLRAEVQRMTKRMLDADAGSAMCDAPKNASQATPTPRCVRERLPDERISYTQTFRLRFFHSDGTPDVMHLYFIVGEYDDGRPGEIFITADQTGTMARGLLDAVGTLASMLLQYGVPLADITRKLRHTRFEPDGWTGNEKVPSCSSSLDLLGRYLDLKYGKKEED